MSSLKRSPLSQPRWQKTSGEREKSGNISYEFLNKSVEVDVLPEELFTISDYFSKSYCNESTRFFYKKPVYVKLDPPRPRY